MTRAKLFHEGKEVGEAVLKLTRQLRPLEKILVLLVPEHRDPGTPLLFVEAPLEPA